MCSYRYAWYVFPMTGNITNLSHSARSTSIGSTVVRKKHLGRLILAPLSNWARMVFVYGVVSSVLSE